MLVLGLPDGSSSATRPPAAYYCCFFIRACPPTRTRSAGLRRGLPPPWSCCRGFLANALSRSFLSIASLSPTPHGPPSSISRSCGFALVPSAVKTARLILFSSSRTLPGRSYASRASTASGVNPVSLFLAYAAYRPKGPVKGAEYHRRDPLGAATQSR
jgi:hypothetical protein